MLRFYAYFKQATEGPCKASRPAFWEVIKKMKWDAWNKLGNMSREEAMNNYVEELKKIVETMSYTDNVASFLGSLGSFYDSVPPEDLELLVGPIIERMRSQPGSPLNGSPFASREASPDRLPSVLNGRSHITSSLETSPASSYSASPLPPDGEEDDEEEEFIDTVETEPDRIVKEPSPLSKVSVPNMKFGLPNAIPNGHIPSAALNGVNGHHEGKEHAMTNGDVIMNGNGTDQGRGRSRERSSFTLKKSLPQTVVTGQQQSRPFNHQLQEGVTADPRQQVVRTSFTSDISEPIGEAVLRLQRDLEQVTGQLNELKLAVSAQNRQFQVKSRTGYPAWWPFKDVSPRLVAFLVLWPFLVNAVIAVLQRRRNNRLM
ncbi:acyl-CoA-binding domain-containing protein 5 isoform X2 [Anabrus simplex]